MGPPENQEIIDRLSRIEGLLEDLKANNHNGADDDAAALIWASENIGSVPSTTATATATTTTHLAVHSPLEQHYHRHSPSDSDLMVGQSTRGLSRVANHVTPEALIPLAEEDGDGYLEMEIRQGEALFSNSTATLQDLDLSPRTCWRLQQSFTRSILPWCPFIDQEECAQIISRACESHFPEHSLETCLALFMLALGAVGKEDYRGDMAIEFHGLDYFQVASTMMVRPQLLTSYPITGVQCRILMAFYLLYCLRPLQTFETIHPASLAVLALLQLKTKLSQDPRLREQVHRAFWACYLVEHELQSIVSYSSCLLQRQKDSVPLPMFDHDEPGSYWFLSEIAFRKIFSNSRDGHGWNVYTTHRPAIVHEILLQLQQWYEYLPPQLRFPMTVSPLMDPHKIFLRAQYYAFVGVLNWSFVVQLLTSQPRDEAESARFAEASIKSLEACVLHVHAVESLFQERHLMLSANISGLHCIAHLLLCTYNVPTLAHVQHPKQGEAVIKARSLLARWTANPIVAANVSRLDALMLAKGLVPMDSDISAFTESSYGVLT